MQRVMIIGGPGSGKTWLAGALSERLKLPVVSVDDHVYRPDGSVRPPDDIDARVRTAAEAESWIIEGGNSRTYLDRLARADTLIRARAAAMVAPPSRPQAP